MCTPADIYGRIRVHHLDRVLQSFILKGPFYIFVVRHGCFLLLWCELFIWCYRGALNTMRLPGLFTSSFSATSHNFVLHKCFRTGSKPAKVVCILTMIDLSML